MKASKKILFNTERLIFNFGPRPKIFLTLRKRIREWVFYYRES